MIHSTSLFAQILALVKKAEFARIVALHNAEYDSKGFSSWTQFSSMLFGQFARCESLREICHGLNTYNGKLSHLGIPEAPRKFTLAYANEHRPWGVYRDVFFHTRGQCEEMARLQKKEISIS